MNLNVHSIHFDADNKLVTFIQEKLSKLHQFHDNILERGGLPALGT
jgi:putative sigma-54 modulation protein